jgi:hypothetical protein
MYCPLMGQYEVNERVRNWRADRLTDNGLNNDAEGGHNGQRRTNDTKGMHFVEWL